MIDILIYSPQACQRLNYILDVIMGERLGLEYDLTHNAATFQSATVPKLCYGRDPLGDAPFMASSRLLFETGVHPRDMSFVDTSKGHALFPTSNRASHWPFDLFSAAFYLLTRYEEYLPFKPDTHGRFELDQSVLLQKEIFRTPIVDRWILDFSTWLAELYPTLNITSPSYRFQPTYDIDIPYAYRMKGLFRSVGGYGRDLFTMNFKALKERLAVNLGRAKDPFDTFEQIIGLHREYEWEPIFFILFAQYGEYDKNPPTHASGFISLIKHLRDHASVGIHPSYRSASHTEALKHEVSSLSAVVNEPIFKSRQHYLKMHLPDTYRTLSVMGIQEDYTMGFASKGGFRAGTSIPYTFYDLEFELPMPLKVVPFAIMDGTLRDYLDLDVDSALEYALSLEEEVRKVGGVFTTLWHNESLSEQGRWKGWNGMYKQLVEHASRT